MPLTRALLTRHFGDIWPVHNRSFTALMITCRRCFDGDLDQMLILSVIGERTLTAQRTKGLGYRAFLDGGRLAPAQPINLQSIADSTGIPRETVRRKVTMLMKRGWVTRNADDTLEVTQAAAIDLAPATQATFDYFLDLGRALTRLPPENHAEAARRIDTAQARSGTAPAAGPA